MKRWAFFACLLAAGSACAAVPAPAKEESKMLRVATPAEFAASRALIEQAVGESEQYRDMQEQDRRDLAKALDRMQATLSRITTVDELDDATRTQIYNDQELINNVLTQVRDDSRMICKREKKVGSHRITNICVTAGERRRRRERVKDVNDIMHRGVRGGQSLFPDYSGGN
jgi:hypothetical protein